LFGGLFLILFEYIEIDLKYIDLNIRKDIDLNTRKDIDLNTRKDLNTYHTKKGGQGCPPHKRCNFFYYVV
jgi:hypothetical protein